MEPLKKAVVATTTAAVLMTGAGVADQMTAAEVTKIKDDIYATQVVNETVVECTIDFADVVTGSSTEQEYLDSCTENIVEFVEYAYKTKDKVNKKNNERKRDRKSVEYRNDQNLIVHEFGGRDQWYEDKPDDWVRVDYGKREKTLFDQEVNDQTLFDLVFGGPEIVYAQSPETFTTNATFTVPAGVTSVEVLVVAGGGSGGAGFAGGGGGAGEVNYHATYSVTPSTDITVVVGTGASGVVPNTSGNTGNDSSFDGHTAHGGGYGGSNVNGGSGGSGGGASGGTGSATGGAADATCPTGWTCSKNAGGDDPSAGAYMAAGGGGAGAAGGDSDGSSAGDGGNGIAYSISGSSVTYGGGGGGAGDGGTAGTGGTGGGGNGGGNGEQAGHGTDGRGAGGGGHWSGANSSGDGGDGVVIVAYSAGSERRVIPTTQY